MSAIVAGHAGRGQVQHGRLVESRGGRQIIQPRRRRFMFQGIQTLPQPDDVLGRGDVAGLVVDLPRELQPRRLVEAAAEIRSGGFAQLVPPSFIAVRRACGTDDQGVRRQSLLAVQLIQRRNQLAASQVAGSSKDYDCVGHRIPFPIVVQNAKAEPEHRFGCSLSP